ncbi:MFS transporter [Actinospica durhamensis]|uniref:MFS transporter n=1 Tax=Actinospica durhamensis TaxID=1508375 RepID=A0A941EQ49_9ACTN|nr:MFS transporter [Actinospica durhamensis]MBR7831709.1 MFS transporter [Actinospica durhamensis]
MSARNAPLGAGFRMLWAASTISTIGDGVTLAAGPMLVASITRDPAAVALAAFALQVPWLLFGLISGVYVDRFDRRRLVAGVNLVRAAALGLLSGAAALDAVTLPLVYAVFFTLGTADTLADNASSALLPALVAPDRLAEANARLSLTFNIGNQFLSKPLGAWLFALWVGAPFGTDALTFLVAAALVATLRPAKVPTAKPTPTPRPRLRTDLTTGIRWLARQRVLRTISIAMGLGNVAFCGAFSIFVLYVHRRLGLTDLGYGLLLTTFAVGGTLGTLSVRRLRRRFGATSLLRAGLFVEALTHLVLAASTHAWIVAVTLVVFGVHTMVWGSLAATLYQQRVPDELRGRVGSVRILCDLGGAAIGTLLGALVAGLAGLTMPFWIAGAAMLVVAVCAWRPLGEASAASETRQAPCTPLRADNTC